MVKIRTEVDGYRGEGSGPTEIACPELIISISVTRVQAVLGCAISVPDWCLVLLCVPDRCLVLL